MNNLAIVKQSNYFSKSRKLWMTVSIYSLSIDDYLCFIVSFIQAFSISTFQFRLYYRLLSRWLPILFVHIVSKDSSLNILKFVYFFIRLYFSL